MGEGRNDLSIYRVHGQVCSNRVSTNTQRLWWIIVRRATRVSLNVCSLFRFKGQTQLYGNKPRDFRMAIEEACSKEHGYTDSGLGETNALTNRSEILEFCSLNQASGLSSVPFFLLKFWSKSIGSSLLICHIYVFGYFPFSINLSYICIWVFCILPG